MSYDLIALDLDDTLLRTDLTISAANKAALREAHARGARVVLASGRNIYSMRAYAEALGLLGEDDYIIASNGGEIVETRTGRLLHERRIPPETCREAAAVLAAAGLPWQVYVSGRIYYSAMNAWTMEDSRLTGLTVEPIAAPEEFFATGQIKFVAPGDPDLMQARRAEVARALAGKAEILISKPYFLEVLPPGVDKGEALLRLAGMLGIPRERVMACGDAMNDLGMLRAAGLGCAPANAIPAAKEAAGYVSALTNDEDFVAEAVGRFVLGRGAPRPDGAAEGRA